MREGDILGGQYRLCERVGRGTHGAVWRAEEVYGGQATIAIKVFHDQPDLAEMRLLARLDHPHMLRYRTTLLHDGKLCLVTDYADGGDAAVLLQAYPDGLPAEPLPKVDQRVNSLTKLLAEGQPRRAVLDASWLLVRDGRDVAFRQKVIPLLRGTTFNAEHRASAATLRADGMRVYRNGAAYWKRHQDLAGRIAIFEAAARLFEAAEKRAPGDVEPVFNRAVIYMELSRPEAALPLFQAVAASARPGQEGIRKRAQVLGERCRTALIQKSLLPGRAY